MSVVLDTSICSSLFKIKKLGLVKEFFNVKAAYIPEAVLEELSKTDFFKEFAGIIAPSFEEASNKSWIVVEKIEPLEDLELGPGERGAIALAKRINGVLLVDDKLAKKKAKEHSISAFDLTAFLNSCKGKGLIDKNTMRVVIQDLKRKDYYSFRKEIEKQLLKY